MSEDFNLYQQLILDHSRHPRNFCTLDCANCYKEGRNPLCGDYLTVYLCIDSDDVIQKASFLGSGCAISVASASLMIETLIQKSCAEARQYFLDFHDMLTNKIGPEKSLGKLDSLKGVSEYPMRVKCATLCWHALIEAINQYKGEDQ